MNSEVLYITNGECFNEYFINKYKEISFPFNECIMDEEVHEDIFSNEFILMRSKALNVSEEVYNNKMVIPIVLKEKMYKKICLWFGKDTFCQMNLLTLLAYLEQINFSGKINLNYIDDETFEVIENDINVKLGIYKDIYKDVLINKVFPNEFGVLNARAIDLYLDYYFKDGELINIVKKNINKDKDELVSLLLSVSKEYGLSNLQIEKMINYIKNKKA